MYIELKKQQIVSIYERNMNNGALFEKEHRCFYVKLKAGLSIIIPANDRYIVEANYYLFGRS